MRREETKQVDSGKLIVDRLTSYIAHMAPHHKEREGGKLLVDCHREIHQLGQVASNNADWFDSLVNELSEILGCEKTPSAVIEAVEKLVNDEQAFPITQSEIRQVCGMEDAR